MCHTDAYSRSRESTRRVERSQAEIPLEGVRRLPRGHRRLLGCHRVPDLGCVHMSLCAALCRPLTGTLIGRIAHFRDDGACVIGLTRAASLTLLIYDLCVPCVLACSGCTPVAANQVH